MYIKDMILNVYKEKDWTSFDIVAKVRGLLGGGRKRKVGHTGTLDPLAEGVLLVLTDEDTKKQQYFMNLEKEYVCEISFGATSPTYDLEGDLSHLDIPSGMDVEKELDKFLPSYVGEIQQRVPPYSAVKVQGRPLYKKVRAGKLDRSELPYKKITIFDIQKVDFFKKDKLTTVKLKITCSKGAYIRSLANDLGEDLKIGGVLVSLVRTRIGSYKIEEAEKISDLEKALKV